MKKGRFALFVLASMISISVQAQTLDEVVDKHLSAMGGKDFLNSLKSIRMEMNLSVQGMDIPMVQTRVQHVGQRSDISVMGMDGFIIVTPEKGWNYMPFLNQAAPEAMSDEELKMGQDDLDLAGLLTNHKENGATVALLGTESLEGKEAYKLSYTSKAGIKSVLFIDAGTGYMVRIVRNAMVNGQETEIAVDYSNFQKTPEGYVFPHSISGAFGQGNITLLKVDINKPVDEKIFKID